MDGLAQRIVVVDLRIPFIRLVWFFVKVSLAAIPAAIILGILARLISAVVAALAGGNVDFMMRRWTI